MIKIPNFKKCPSCKHTLYFGNSYSYTKEKDYCSLGCNFKFEVYFNYSYPIAISFNINQIQIVVYLNNFYNSFANIACFYSKSVDIRYNFDVPILILPVEKILDIDNLENMTGTDYFILKNKVKLLTTFI